MSTMTEFSGSVPHNYDHYLGPLFFEPYALDLFERLKGRSFDRVLELASGTGRVTRHLAELVKEGGQLYATDLNPDMLQLAQQKVKASNISWQVVDAHLIPYENNFFDIVVCQFGVMFFKDKAKAFSEIYRVLNPQGIFLFNTWDHYQHNAASRLTQEVMNEVFPDDAPDFLVKGPYSLYELEQIRGLLKEAGFTQIEITTVAKTGQLQAAEDVAIGFVEGSPLTGYLEERNAPKETIKNKITEAIKTNYPQLEFPMQALVCTAIKI